MSQRNTLIPRYVIQVQEVDPETATEYFAKMKAQLGLDQAVASAAPERHIFTVDASEWRSMDDF